jgi:23S rRNA pseudouridine2605 synthase
VTVDGVPARLGDRADPRRQRVAVDGKALALERHAYWIAHKPRGVLTTRSDPHGRPTVLDLLPPGLPRLYPVGRLDWDTEGLVLLTNDGDVAHALMHPSRGSEREYRVSVRGPVPVTTLRRLAEGVELDDGPTAPARVGVARFDRGADRTTFPLVLHEGRKRQIRRAMEALGHPVVRLLRVRMGPIVLGTLEPGRARALREEEVARLRAHARRTGRQAGGKDAAQAHGSGGKVSKRARGERRNS